MKMEMKKRGFEFSFGWLFAIIVGSVIIFLAVYGTTRLIGTESQVRNTELGRELDIILNPLETGVEDGKKPAKIVLSSETEIFNSCSSAGDFGFQEISVSAESGLEGDEGFGVPSRFNNKYISSGKLIKDDEFTAFSKSFEAPYKSGTLIYLWQSDEKYCFVDPPREIEDEIEGLNLDIEMAFRGENEGGCSEESKRVCFATSGCDIDVSLGIRGFGGSVEKDFSRVYFEGDSLLYGAIFSDPDIYECQVKRLMKRTSKLAEIYFEKSQYLRSLGCNSNLGSELLFYANETKSLKESIELGKIFEDSKEINRRNNDGCKLF